MDKKKQLTPYLRRRLLGLLTASGFVVCLSTVLGFLGQFSWALDLLSHFRVQYALGLSLLAILLFLMRCPRTAIVFIAFACVNFSIIIPMYFNGMPPATNPDHTLRAMLLNVNTSSGDAKRVEQIVREINPDILVLEEISPQWIRDLHQLKESYPYSRILARNDNFGIGLFSKYPLIEDEIRYIGDANVPTVLATVDTEQGNLHVIATHPLPPISAAYSQQRNDQLEQLPSHIPSSGSVILLGDLNTTPWNYYFKRLLKRTGLIDGSKGFGVQPTWPIQAPFLLIPIDHCLHSSDISVINKTVGSSTGSDHYPIIIDFMIKDNVRK